jgi:hypothetical protein
MTNMPQTDSPRPSYPWWEFLVPGLLLLLGSIYIWWFLTELEQKSGVHRLPSAAILLYRWGGKWAVVLFAVAVGALFSGIGAWKLFRELRSRSGDTQRDHHQPGLGG